MIYCLNDFLSKLNGCGMVIKRRVETKSSKILSEITLLLGVLLLTIVFQFLNHSRQASYIAITLMNNNNNSQIEALYNDVEKAIHTANLNQYITVKITNKTIYVTSKYEGFPDFLTVAYKLVSVVIAQKEYYSSCTIYIYETS